MREEYVEQILENQQTIMNVLYNMCSPTITQYNCGSIERTIATDNSNRLIYHIEETADLLERKRKENKDE
jgi:hypothetical protein